MAQDKPRTKTKRRTKDGKRKRRTFTSEQKADLLRRHLVDKVPVSDLCEEHDLQPSLFYGWLNQLYANLGAALTDPRKAIPRERELEKKVENLEARVAKKDAVIAEISEEYVQLKKELGEP